MTVGLATDGEHPVQLGLQRDGGRAVRHRLVEPARIHVERAAKAHRPGVLGVEGEGGVEVGHGRLHIAGAEGVGAAAVRMCRGVPGHERDGPVEIGDGLRRTLRHGVVVPALGERPGPYVRRQPGGAEDGEDRHLGLLLGGCRAQLPRPPGQLRVVAVLRRLPQHVEPRGQVRTSHSGDPRDVFQGLPQVRGRVGAEQVVGLVQRLPAPLVVLPPLPLREPAFHSLPGCREVLRQT